MGKEIKKKYDAVVVGSGIGGLLAGAFLAQKGKKVCLLEALAFLGGKFTAFNYRGFQIPSGAFHMVPGGAKGNLGRCFSELELDLEYRYPRSALVVLEGGRQFRIRTNPRKTLRRDSYLWRFKLKEIISFILIIHFMFRRKGELPDISFGDFISLFSASPRIKKVFNKFMIFANGTDIHSASLVEFIQSIKAANYNKEGLVVGGCRHLIDELSGYIERHGGEIFTRTPAASIEITGKRAKGVTLADGTFIAAKMVVTNVGPSRTVELLGQHAPDWFKQKEQTFLPAYGVSYSVATDRPLVDHDGVEVPIDYNHICGFIQISTMDSSLAPPGKHLLLAAQMVTDQNADIKREIEGGVRDLLAIFPGITRENIINISCFHKGWAACPTGQRKGQSGFDRYPIKLDPFENVFMISHDSQGWGFAADVIGYAAWNFRKMI